MSDIKLNIEPGYISALYFVVFGLFLLPLFDGAISRIACCLYYRRIKAGLPISICSADFPGVATNLIGRYYSRVNMTVYLLKILLLSLLFYIDLGISNTKITETATVSRTGVFVFNASDSAWEGHYRSVERRWEYVRQCHVREGNTVQFYHVAFDLSHGVHLDSELISDSSAIYELNDTTLSCLSPKFVPEKHAIPMISVIGCSQLISTTCLNETMFGKFFGGLDAFRSYMSDRITIYEGSQPFTYELLHYDSNVLFKIFPGYATASNNSTMTCTSSFIGISSKQTLRQIFNCLLVVYNKSTTIIERWEYNMAEKKLIRYLPGPVFNGTIDYGWRGRAIQLSAVHDRTNWLSFSATIIADSVVYEPRNQTFDQYTAQTEGTSVSGESANLAVLLLVLGIITQIVVAFTVRRDDRPQLNTIDGLSSIAREEIEPSGQSYVAGDKVLIGWIYKTPSLIHFGPVRSAKECIKMFQEKEIEMRAE